jgi:hypothetical protein
MPSQCLDQLDQDGVVQAILAHAVDTDQCSTLITIFIDLPVTGKEVNCPCSGVFCGCGTKGNRAGYFRHPPAI